MRFCFWAGKRWNSRTSKNGCFASRRLNLFALLALANDLSESSDYLRESGENQDEKVKGYLLSSNTLIAKSNKTGADMHFIIGLKNDSNKYESGIYLKLNSFSNEENSWGKLILFDVQAAKDYLGCTRTVSMQTSILKWNAKARKEEALT